MLNLNMLGLLLIDQEQRSLEILADWNKVSKILLLESMRQLRFLKLHQYQQQKIIFQIRKFKGEEQISSNKGKKVEHFLAIHY